MESTTEDDFHDWDDFLNRFNSSLSGKINSTHIFLVSENNWKMNSSGFHSKLIMKINVSDMEDAPVIEHNCIKQGFEREKHLSGSYKLKEAMLARKNI